MPCATAAHFLLSRSLFVWMQWILMVTWPFNSCLQNPPQNIFPIEERGTNLVRSQSRSLALVLAHLSPALPFEQHFSRFPQFRCMLLWYLSYRISWHLFPAHPILPAPWEYLPPIGTTYRKMPAGSLASALWGAGAPSAGSL